MVTLGIIVTNLLQEEDYFTAIAEASVLKNVSIFLFSPKDIDLTARTARGKAFCPHENQWLTKDFPLPTYIYDRCFYDNEDTFKSIYPNITWLKSQPDIQFLGHGLPNKWVVFNALKEDPFINHFLPETELLTTDTLFTALSRLHSILVKPVSGSQGKGIFIVSSKNKKFALTAKKYGTPFEKLLSKKQLEHLVEKVTEKRRYLCQPFLSLNNHEQRPFDLRVFLQRNSQGDWTEIGRGIRTGKIGDFTSNLGSGGQVESYEDWLHLLPLDAQLPLQTQLQALIERIPSALEKHGYELFELGLDFGFDTDGKLWLLEVNSKPGRKVITTSFPHKTATLASSPIHYCLYLDAKRKGVGVS
ncbi:YheC/YheD family protein [Anaerobacillus alkaliphilus]|uniref:YheC/YheD family protein n=1 Tax=Anaerobacillus alkaliphilus TaxID=1548597 RepID=A0A4Q0VRI9_9BACI|nr:YheC/YheD family protein [Anaerobacillus alkaliphilus]RXI99870.1 YheC/YheD family protein [Anaerobacillus alkaliphilus]